MKLLLITAVREFEKDIKQILKKAQVKSFSYKDVKGFKDNSEDALEANWFATNMQETESILFYAFVKEDKVDGLFDMVKEFNTDQVSKSHIHVAVLSIERCTNLINY
jgi:nitrogen regulatory protein PII